MRRKLITIGALLSKIERPEDETAGCWWWLGDFLNRKPVFGGKVANRIVWEAIKGTPLFKGESLVSLCGWTTCVSPFHYKIGKLHKKSYVVVGSIF